MEQPGVEEGPHDDRHPSHPVDVAHHIATERLHVGEEWNLRADAMEVLDMQVDVRLMGDGKQVEDRIRRAAERHQYGDRVLEGLAGDDVAGGDPLSDQLDDSLP